MLGSVTIPLFPLSTVLFSGGYLPLHIFEPRYLQMIRDCVESGIGFGVVLIKEGDEVHDESNGDAPAIHSIGTLAEVEELEELPENRLAVLATGGAKFKVEATWQEENHLMMGEVTFIPDEPARSLQTEDEDLVSLLHFALEERQVPSAISERIDFSDAREVSLRLADYLPFSMEEKQKLLQMDSSRVRLTIIRQWSLP